MIHAFCLPLIISTLVCEWGAASSNSENRVATSAENSARVSVHEDAQEYLVSFLFAFPESSIDGLPMSQPQALCTDAEGNVFVVDTGNNRLLRFSDNGDFQIAVGGFGWTEQQFDRPLDISAKTGLDLFVADFNNQRIERYDLNLNYISSYRRDETLPEPLQFGFPTGVDVSRHGELFICDNEFNRVLKLDRSGNPELSFGDFRSGEGQLERPASIEVSRSDLVYVADESADQIFVFDYYGNFVTRFGKGILRGPNGLAWSSNQRLFVADSGNHRVVVFDKTHRQIFQWGEHGKKIGAFQQPVDVAFFRDRVHVLDSVTGRVQAFRLTATDAPDD